MEAIDFKKTFRHLYRPSAKSAELVEVPPMTYLAVDGAGAPGDEDFQEAIGALYAVAYTLKFSRKKKGVEPDYSMGALEGLWWCQDPNADPHTFDISRANWRLLLWVPDLITEEEVAQVIAELISKKDNRAIARVRLERFEEGRSLQVMHVGPYSDEARSVAKLESAATERGLRFHGCHHEIYLGDPRRAAPERLRTIIRHPVR